MEVYFKPTNALVSPPSFSVKKAEFAVNTRVHMASVMSSLSRIFFYSHPKYNGNENNNPIEPNDS